MKDVFIVKVQLSQATSQYHQQMLVYNRNKSIYFEGDATDEVKALMPGRYKAYFEAELVEDKVVLLQEINKQPW